MNRSSSSYESRIIIVNFSVSFSSLLKIIIIQLNIMASQFIDQLVIDFFFNDDWTSDESCLHRYTHINIEINDVSTTDSFYLLLLSLLWFYSLLYVICYIYISRMIFWISFYCVCLLGPCKCSARLHERNEQNKKMLKKSKTKN